MRTGAPRPAINSAWQWVSLATMFWLVRQLVDDRREVRAIAAVMVALAVTMSTFGFHQFFYSIPRDQARFRRGSRGGTGTRRTSSRPWLAAAAALREAREQQRADGHVCAGELAGRISGPLADRVVGHWRRGVCVANARSATVAAGVACAAIILACLVLTKSRAGDIGQHVAHSCLAAWTAAVGSRLSRRIVIAVFASVVVVVVAASVVGALDREMLTEAGKSLGYRLQYWQATWAMICDRPWFGCGPGQFQGYYTQYKLPEASETVADPHNFLLEIWATAGTPAALALLAVIGIVAWQVWKDSRLTAAIDAAKNPPDLNPTPAARATQQGAARGTPLSSPGRVSREFNTIPVFADATHHILAGGAGGFLLALLFGPLATVPLGLAACGGGLAVAAVVVAALYPWIERGAMPAVLLALAAVVLLINLLAGGGINFAGVAGSLWLLAALCLATLERWQKLTTVPAGLLLTMIAILGGAFYLTVYQPAMACNMAMDRADIDPERRRAFPTLSSRR